MLPKEIIYELQHSKIKELVVNFGLKKMRGQWYFNKVIEWEIDFLIVHMWLTSCMVTMMSICCKRRRRGSCPQSSKRKLLMNVPHYMDRDSPR
jgi:hypothetical protein